jgi:predicted DNA-binding transcriptional regulator YafY
MYREGSIWFKVMQEFLKNNVVNCNLMSLTGYRTLILLDALLESPKSLNELNECFLQNQYIKEKFSSDTLRLYINSLRKIGCEITKASKSTKNKYILQSHPFTLDITRSQLLALSKIYKNIYTKLPLSEIITCENLFKKVSKIIGNPKAIGYLKNLSVLKNIDMDLLKTLMAYVRRKNEIDFLYNSPNSGDIEVCMETDKLALKSKKLYLCGYSSLHEDYAYLRVDRIKKILSVSLKSKEKETEVFKVIFSITSKNEYVPLEDEIIISKSEDKYTIEKSAKSKFRLIQDMLFRINECEIIAPAEIKAEILQKLKEMEGLYND